MRITRVYTRTGDKGSTGLADGSRIPKNDIRIDTYGTVDELNSILGIAREQLDSLEKDKALLMKEWLYALQNDLFNLGSDLATPHNARWKGMILTTDEDVKKLESLIDFCQECLAPLKEFVLPGGSPLNATLHLARTVCRRAERLGVSLGQQVELNPNALPFLNRLSDLLFVLSRWALHHTAHGHEVVWDRAAGVRTLSLPPSTHPER